MHTIDEIQAHFTDYPIHDIWINPKMYYLKIATYDNAQSMFDNGQISELQWMAYQAIWRNLTYHYSSLAMSFEF